MTILQAVRAAERLHAKNQLTRVEVDDHNLCHGAVALASVYCDLADIASDDGLQFAVARGAELLHEGHLESSDLVHSVEMISEIVARFERAELALTGR